MPPGRALLLHAAAKTAATNQGLRGNREGGTKETTERIMVDNIHDIACRETSWSWLLFAPLFEKSPGMRRSWRRRP